MLYLVGLGLTDETDITVKGLDVVKKAERVYLEAYTSILLVDKEKLVSLPGSLVPASCNHSILRLGLMSSFISRKHTMADLSYWPTGRWLNHPVMQSSRAQIPLI